MKVSDCSDDMYSDFDVSLFEQGEGEFTKKPVCDEELNRFVGRISRKGAYVKKVSAEYNLDFPAESSSEILHDFLIGENDGFEKEKSNSSQALYDLISAFIMRTSLELGSRSLRISHRTNAKATDALKRIICCPEFRLSHMIILLQHGADPNVPINSQGDFPLHHFVSKCNFKAIRYLIEYKANINSLNNSNKSPLMILCNVKESIQTLQILKYMLKFPSLNLYHKDSDGASALMLAILNYNLFTIRILLKHGIQVFYHDSYRYSIPPSLDSNSINTSSCRYLTPYDLIMNLYKKHILSCNKSSINSIIIPPSPHNNNDQRSLKDTNNNNHNHSRNHSNDPVIIQSQRRLLKSDVSYLSYMNLFNLSLTKDTIEIILWIISYKKSIEECEYKRKILFENEIYRSNINNLSQNIPLLTAISIPSEHIHRNRRKNSVPELSHRKQNLSQINNNNKVHTDIEQMIVDTSDKNVSGRIATTSDSVSGALTTTGCHEDSNNNNNMQQRETPQQRR